jgi:hypothetical protein
VIEITNPGVRVASEEVTEKLAKGEKVDPGAITSAPRRVSMWRRGYDWMRRSIFVARGGAAPRR